MIAHPSGNAYLGIPALRWLVLGMVFVLLVSLLVPAPAVTRSQDFPAALSSSSSTLATTPDGAELLVANPDSNSLTFVDTATQVVQAEIAVGVGPVSVAVAPGGERAYVANQGADSLAVVDIAQRVVSQTLALGGRPSGVAVSPDGRLLAVAESGEDRIRLLNPQTLQILALLPVTDRPYGLAFTPDSRRLLVTHLLRGSLTVLLVQPWQSFFPLVGVAALPGETDRSPPPASLNAPLASPASLLVIARSIATWPNVAPAPAVIVNSAGSRAYLAQTMANGLGLNTSFDTTVFPKVSVINLANNTHQATEHISLPETDRPVGLPWSLALVKNDQELWVVNSASNDLSVIDLSLPTFPRRTAHIYLQDRPRGIVFSADGSRAYVNNTLAGTLSVIDAVAYQVIQTIPVTTLPLPPALLNGKRLFHSSARSDLAQARWISCNTCHIEGEHDGRTWLVQYLGEVPPGEQPVIRRNTTSLLGMIETYPLRWSAEWDESADSEFSVRFEQFGAGLIDGSMNPTLGAPNQGRSYDLDCLALFIDSLAAPAHSQSLSEAAQRGKAIFESPQAGCAVCHPAPLYSDLQTHDVGTANGPGEWFGPSIDTPTLRFLYDSAPYLHDGSAASLLDVLTTKNLADEHGVTSHLDAQELQDLIAYLLALP
jgi:YVTN family beta-propeller protein